MILADFDLEKLCWSGAFAFRWDLSALLGLQDALAEVERSNIIAKNGIFVLKGQL